MKRTSDEHPYRARGPALEAAPRHVPAPVRVRLMLNHLAQVGWGTAVVGSVALWLLIANVDPHAGSRFEGPVERRSGTVIESVSSRSDDGTVTWSIHYQFTDANGERRTGESIGKPLGPGTRVQIEYPRGNPSISRIEGMHRPALGPIGYLLAFPLPLGLVLAVLGMRQGRRKAQLLAVGRPGAGRLIDTSVERGPEGERSYRLTFEFTADDGRVYRHQLETASKARFEGEGDEPLVYHPADPECSAMMDDLPGNPRIDAEGRIVNTGWTPTGAGSCYCPSPFWPRTWWAPFWSWAEEAPTGRCKSLGHDLFRGQQLFDIGNGEAHDIPDIFGPHQ
ncbi:MAG: hypothetical protein IT370_21500 [Deltaproteobacteria bacterium]|nr:hypothetical protein [Deltaproteobacteria bacterium]